MSGKINTKAAAQYGPNTVIEISVGAFHQETGARQPVHENLTLKQLGFSEDVAELPEFDNDKFKSLQATQGQDAAFAYLNEYNDYVSKVANAQGGEPALRLFKAALEYLYNKYNFTPEDRTDGFVLASDSVTLNWLDAAGGRWQLAGAAHWG